MNESYYIGIDDYNIIRKGLLDKNNNVIKTAIQKFDNPIRRRDAII